MPPHIAARIVERDGCHIWTGAVNSKGYGIARYGTCRPGGRPVVYLHRLALHLVDPTVKVSPGRGKDHVDHRCVTPRCVNPNHLEAVSAAENNRRARARAALRALVAGHPAGSAL